MGLGRKAWRHGFDSSILEHHNAYVGEEFEEVSRQAQIEAVRTSSFKGSMSPTSPTSPTSPGGQGGGRRNVRFQDDEEETNSDPVTITLIL